MKNLRFDYKHFFTSVKQKSQKNGKNAPIFAKSEAYASLLRLYFMFTDSLLIIQMLKFKIKRDIKRTDFWKKRVLFESYSSSIRVLCVLTTSLLHGY